MNILETNNDFELSDEEELRNTIGNVPLEWYSDMEFIGYDLDGNKIVKPSKEKVDQLDTFIKKIEHEDYLRTVIDNQTGQSIVLSNDDIEIIKQLTNYKCVNNDDDHINFSKAFMSETVRTSLSGRPEHKRSFIPSKFEKLKVGKYVHSIKMGWIKPRKPQEDPFKPSFYDLWENENNKTKLNRLMHHLPAPKLELPGHQFSYNPPLEYILNESEQNSEKLKSNENNETLFIPKKYTSLRLVPSYNEFIKEQFNRCLDMYLCPRQRKMKVKIDPGLLLPKLPKPNDLQPFPSELSIVFEGHSDTVSSISVHSEGEWLVSGSNDKTIKFWEISTGRCIKTIQLQDVVKFVSWIPNNYLNVVAVVSGISVYLINPGLGDKLITNSTDIKINNFKQNFEQQINDGSLQSNVKWIFDMNVKNEYQNGFRVEIIHNKKILYFTWHQRGDYCATVIEEKTTTNSVIIHQLSKQKSLIPFQKLKGLVQQVKFHPIKPIFFVATQRYIKIYDLIQQSLIKKLYTNCQWVNCLDIHPAGDNLIIGSYDSRVSWFDLDLSSKPYKTLKYHKGGIRSVNFHRTYPIFASASDDGSVVVCHGMVYNDLNQNPLIVPLKVLKNNYIKNKIGITCCEFHPKQPWIITAGTHKNIFLYSN